ncbi:hypothetical protein BDY24DRAFT_195921 [Mrakia frigida]|uniref:uncharacterized protein n=1 Tax=Mrakia frigida TaxID=29902 RepID=UPI003FCC114F
MTTIFSSLSIPPLLSLFSSSTFPHPLWQSSTDPFLPEDSLLLHFPSDSPSSSPSPFPPLPPNAALVPTSINNKKKKNGSIAHPVVHLQSPNVKTTFLRFPPKNLQKELGLPMEWIHFVLKPLGKRELVLEVGVKDGRGFRGVVRISTFTVSRIDLSHRKKGKGKRTKKGRRSSSPLPLLLLPTNRPPLTSPAPPFRRLLPLPLPHPTHPHLSCSSLSSCPLKRPPP